MIPFVRKSAEEIRRMSVDELIAYNREMRACVASRPQTDETRAVIEKLDADVAKIQKVMDEEKQLKQKVMEQTHAVAIAEDNLRECLKKMSDDRSKAVNLQKAYLMIGRVSPAAAIQFLVAATKPPDKH